MAAHLWWAAFAVGTRELILANRDKTGIILITIMEKYFYRKGAGL
jgi:hypothetical protein